MGLDAAESPCIGKMNQWKANQRAKILIRTPYLRSVRSLRGLGSPRPRQALGDGCMFQGKPLPLKWEKHWKLISGNMCLMLPDLEKERREYIHHDFLSHSRVQDPILFTVNLRPLQQRFILQVTASGSNVSKHILVPSHLSCAPQRLISRSQVSVHLHCL